MTWHRSLVLGLLISAGLHGQVIQGVFSGTYGTSGGSTVADPTTSNSGGSCTGSDGAGWTCSGTTTVSMLDATGAATICYTTTGATPGAAVAGTCDSSPTQTYSSGISTSSTTTYKMIGTKAGSTNSNVVTVTYTIGANLSLVGQGHGIGTSTPVTTLSVGTTSGSASSGGGTTLDIGSHDGIYVTVMFASSGSTCYTAAPTVTVTDTGTTNTFTQIGSVVTNAFWGNPCSYHFFATGVTKANDTITASWTGAGEQFPTIDVLQFHYSSGATWTVANHDEKSGGSASSITSASLGNGSAGDLLVAGAALSQATATWAAGACANSANCTLASTTNSTLAVIEYQILTGSQTGATAAISSTATGGINMVSARITVI